MRVRSTVWKGFSIAPNKPGVTLHLSEVKGPVLDRLKRSEFRQHLTGGVFLSEHQAMSTLDPEATSRAAAPDQATHEAGH